MGEGFTKPNSIFCFSCQEEKPLEFEDIVDKRTYDKMRPPKPQGETLFDFADSRLIDANYLLR